MDLLSLLDANHQMIVFLAALHQNIFSVEQAAFVNFETFIHLGFVDRNGAVF